MYPLPDSLAALNSLDETHVHHRPDLTVDQNDNVELSKEVCNKDPQVCGNPSLFYFNDWLFLIQPPRLEKAIEVTIPSMEEIMYMTEQELEQNIERIVDLVTHSVFVSGLIGIIFI